MKVTAIAHFFSQSPTGVFEQYLEGASELHCARQTVTRTHCMHMVGCEFDEQQGGIKSSAYKCGFTHVLTANRAQKSHEFFLKLL